MPEYIMGFAVGAVTEQPQDATHDQYILPCLHLHYCFTKLSYRNAGIAGEMVRGLGWYASMPILATHWTRYAAVCMTEKKSHGRNSPLSAIHYNPFLLMELQHA